MVGWFGMWEITGGALNGKRNTVLYTKRSNGVCVSCRPAQMRFAQQTIQRNQHKKKKHPQLLLLITHIFFPIRTRVFSHFNEHLAAVGRK